MGVLQLRAMDTARGNHAITQQYSGIASHDFPLRSTLSPDGRYVASGSEDGTLSAKPSLTAAEPP